jgi:hypothetical protein
MVPADASMAAQSTANAIKANFAAIRFNVIFSPHTKVDLYLPAPSLMDVQPIATEEDCTSRGRYYAFCRLVATLRTFLTFLRPTVRIPRAVHGAQQWTEDIPPSGKIPSFAQ